MLVLRLLFGFAPAPRCYGPLVLYSWPYCLKVYSYHVAPLHWFVIFFVSFSMDLEILAVGEEEDLTRPCVDCGLYTGRYCDYCFAARRIPSEEWSRGQRTPLCSRCDNRWNACHFCRGLHWCTPAAWGTAADYVKQAQAKRDWKRWRDTKRPSDPSTPARR